jgi:pimeloyl-ACP methyl ester carboxylesterase
LSPVRVHYRDAGTGRPLVILHGGWGYEVYPFDRQIGALAPTHRVIVPDRTGYGRSPRMARQETDFHRRAAAETWAVIDALGLDQPTLWGHSDGAIIALLMGLSAPDRLHRVIVEATHFFRSKPSSGAFFETMVKDPDGLGERVGNILERDHGSQWRDQIRMNGDAWLRIASDPSAPTPDLYGGRLGEFRVPVLVIHGARDPRTEPGELDALRAALDRRDGGQSRFVVLPDGGHSPHSERATADEVTRLALEFLKQESVQTVGPDAS